MFSEGAALSQAMILGVVQSGHARMHELLGRLLLAARLQEGLRQSICEAADLGTVEAFLLLLDVIRENNLIRYSSVKRAVGVWMGLMTEETQDLERISAKTLELALGFASPKLYAIPEGITVTVENDGLLVTVTGIDKALVGEVAARIRSFYPAEPYKGKGVKYEGERIRRKQGKKVA